MARRYSYEVPVLGMLKKFYCFKCGKKLEKIKSTELDVEEGGFYASFRMLNLNIGYKPETIVHNIKYNYRCKDCKIINTYDEQEEVAEMQKIVGHHVLTDHEIGDINLITKAQTRIKNRKLISKIIENVIFVIIILICFYFCLKQNNII